MLLLLLLRQVRLTREPESRKRMAHPASQLTTPNIISSIHRFLLHPINLSRHPSIRSSTHYKPFYIPFHDPFSYIPSYQPSIHHSISPSRNPSTDYNSSYKFLYSFHNHCKPIKANYNPPYTLPEIPPVYGAEQFGRVTRRVDREDCQF